MKTVEDFNSSSHEDTYNAGKKLGRRLAGGEIIGLEGELGAGKTVFVKGVAAGLDVPENEHVGSPTFKLINSYEGRFILQHLDLYRLSGIEEILDLGIFDLIDENSVVIFEWAEKLARIDLSFDYYIKMEYLSGDKRKITFLKTEPQK